MAGQDHGQVISCHTQQAWETFITSAKENKKWVIIDFTASWCPPCRNIAPIFADLAKHHTDVLFVKVDVDELQSIAEKFEVEAMPTFVLLKEGEEEVQRIVGADKVKLADALTSINLGTATA